MKIGLVGYGSIGQRHAHNFEQLGHQTIVYDPAPNKRRDVRFERDVYDEADAIVICTPSWMHPAGLRAAIERGKPVLVEKPIATSSPDAIGDLLSFAKSKNVPVMMANMLRFHPVVERLKQYQQPFRWGSFICEGPVRQTNRQDGVIINTGAHEVDLATYLLGPIARALCSHAENGAIADFIVEHESGARSAFHLEFTQDHIQMTRGANLIAPSGIYMSLGLLLDDWDKVYLDEAKSFLDMIEGKPDPRRATGDDGLATLRVLLDVKKMAETK